MYQELIRLVYISHYLPEKVSLGECLKIQDTAIQNNERLGITGMFYVNVTGFLQVLEGPSSKVNNLFLKVSNDPRHCNVEILEVSPAIRRYFADWKMKLVNRKTIPEGVLEFFRSKYGKAEDGEIPILLTPYLRLTFSKVWQFLSECMKKELE